MYPPVWYLFPRKCIQSHTVTCGYTGENVQVPKGMHVLLSPLLAHNSSQIWKMPERFDPERWHGEPFLLEDNGRPSVGNVDSRVPRTQPTKLQAGFFPFGFGGHTCLGRRIAVLMIKRVVSTLLSAANPEIISGWSLFDKPVTQRGIETPAFFFLPKVQVAMNFHNLQKKAPSAHNSPLTAWDKSSICKCCGSKLGKRYLRPRHHCRLCCSSICSKCSVFTAFAPGFMSTRMCHLCHESKQIDAPSKQGVVNTASPNAEPIRSVTSMS